MRRRKVIIVVGMILNTGSCVGKKELAVWNEVVEKVNVDCDGNTREFWAFMGRRTKDKKRNIASLRNEAGDW